ncbi:Thioredoxin domain protein [Ignavibacterium album JCM 16511]|uniref:Thioredoxin domain protein n=1 Tax=Ignavibacterium album (strain DSM 19864 / JCM 16511 / NBRC 101810 / Mat9-16) TaxID=945713 RepID=I0ANH0_IGNAJ|nr:thioredoxin family protein [Ignavibacterium album]AFH50527.1 Thioredoxin domain protein [Ignavibacterium album JCM 16511]
MKHLTSIILLVTFIFVQVCAAQSKENKSQTSKSSKTKVTFIELGSVNCVPCKMMQPVMKSIEKKYDDQVKVVFYDVWTKEQKQYAQLYNIKLIPTQIFLDENGKEFHRHEGFYPEAEIDKVLSEKGLKPKG